jgi:hypothetical protein
MSAVYPTFAIHTTAERGQICCLINSLPLGFSRHFEWLQLSSSIYGLYYLQTTGPRWCSIITCSALVSGSDWSCIYVAVAHADLSSDQPFECGIGLHRSTDISASIIRISQTLETNSILKRLIGREHLTAFSHRKRFCSGYIYIHLSI